MNQIEIVKVANGYMVRPIDPSRSTYTPLQETNVFETFEALTLFLKKALSGKVKPRG